jgi:hypothetical protein
VSLHLLRLLLLLLLLLLHQQNVQQQQQQQNRFPCLIWLCSVSLAAFHTCSLAWPPTASCVCTTLGCFPVASVGIEAPCSLSAARVDWWMPECARFNCHLAAMKNGICVRCECERIAGRTRHISVSSQLELHGTCFFLGDLGETQARTHAVMPPLSELSPYQPFVGRAARFDHGGSMRSGCRRARIPPS